MPTLNVALPDPDDVVLDTHTHAWGPPSEAHPWVNATVVEYFDRFSVDTVYTAEKLLADMDRVGVDEAVLVGYPVCHWTDNWYTLRAVEAHDRLYGIVMLDQFADDAADRLRDAMAVDGVLGFRLGVGSPYEYMWEAPPEDAGEPTWLLDAIEETEFWATARETDALVQVSAGADQLEQVRRLIERYPDLTYVLDGFGPLSPGAQEELRDRFATLAEYDTVAVKASHAPSVSNEAFPYEDLHGELRWLLDTFGRERVAWGSDFPNASRHGATYPEAKNWLSRVDGLTEEEVASLESRAFETHAGLA